MTVFLIYVALFHTMCYFFYRSIQAYMATPKLIFMFIGRYDVFPVFNKCVFFIYYD